MNKTQIKSIDKVITEAEAKAVAKAKETQNKAIAKVKADPAAAMKRIFG